MTAIPFVRTHSGIDVPLRGAQPHHINFRDVAHHLALINRFAGATQLPYSVAQHSVFVSEILLANGEPDAVAFWGLLHDAHEAYTGDIPSPVKDSLRQDVDLLTGLESVLDVVIATAAGLSLTAAGLVAVRAADAMALATEWRSLMQGPCPIEAAPAPLMVKPMPWPKAEEAWLKAFNRFARRLGTPEAGAPFF